MKSIIVAFIFGIGLMLALPDPSLGSCSPPGQSSFVVGHFEIAPAIAFVQENTFVVYQSQLAPVAIELREKGGCAIEKSLNTSLAIGYSNKNAIVNTTNLKLQPDYCRLCRPLMAKQNQKFINQNIRSVNRLARDGLTQG